MIDITHAVADTVNESGLKTGICTIFCTGSTGSVTTIEYEDGLLHDFPAAMERIAPKDAVYDHHLRWHDGNGQSLTLEHPFSDQVLLCLLSMGTSHWEHGSKSALSTLIINHETEP